MISARFSFVQLIVLAGVVATNPPSTAQNTWYVDPDASGAQTGQTWDTAFHDLQAALSRARADDQVLVADGTYLPDSGAGDPARSFVLRSGVALRGGYAGAGAEEPNTRDVQQTPSVLSGDIGTVVLPNLRSLHVVSAINADASALLEGFTIIGGRATGGSPNGGGLLCAGGAPTIRDCRFMDNAASSGGAAHVEAGGAPRFEFCWFEGNRATFLGGAIAAIGAGPMLINCDVVGNDSDFAGGGLCAFAGANLTVRATRLRANWAQIQGGGAYVYGSAAYFDGVDFLENLMLNNLADGADGGGGLFADGATATLIGCNFQANLTSDDGAAAYLRNGSSRWINCGVVDNFAADNGGVYLNGGAAQFVNVKFVLNTTFGRGAALAAVGGSTDMRNCTVVENRSYTAYAAGVHVQAGALEAHNSIFWMNRNHDGAQQSAQLAAPDDATNVRYCCVQGLLASLPGEGNIERDPMFLNLAGRDGVLGTADDDVRVAAGSPCVDSASNADLPADALDLDGDGDVGEPIPIDLAWSRRVRNGEVDIGALEASQFAASIGDMNCDGIVNNADIDPFVLAITDARAYIAQFADCFLTNGDVNLDGRVDNADVDSFVAIIMDGP